MIFPVGAVIVRSALTKAAHAFSDNYGSSFGSTRHESNTNVVDTVYGGFAVKHSLGHCEWLRECSDGCGPFELDRNGD